MSTTLFANENKNLEDFFDKYVFRPQPKITTRVAYFICQREKELEDFFFNGYFYVCLLKKKLGFETGIYMMYMENISIFYKNYIILTKTYSFIISLSVILLVLIFYLDWGCRGILRG